MTAKLLTISLIFLCLSQGYHCKEKEVPPVLEAAKTLVKSIYNSDYFCFGWKTAAVSVTALAGVPLAAGALGFGAAGIAAGSMAAAYQSTMAGSIVSGSVFSALQSIGAAGLSSSVQAGIVAGSAGVVGYFFGFECSDGETPDSKGKCYAKK